MQTQKLMSDKMFKNLVAIHKGWIEDNVARFPSVYNREMFEKACRAFYN